METDGDEVAHRGVDGVAEPFKPVDLHE